MKKSISLSNWLIACGLALAAVFVPTLSAQSVKDGKAVVAYINGKAQYAGPDGVWHALKKDMEISVGATVQTEADSESYVDLSLNEDTCLVRIVSGSTVTIEKMVCIGSPVDGDTDTSLKLQEGTVLGSVKKISKASHFDIKVPNGVAGIRGTDFAVTAKKLPTGQWQVTFTSVRGEVVASANVSDSIVTKVLYDGDSWTPGDEVVKVNLATFFRIIEDMNNNNRRVVRPHPGRPENPLRPVSPALQLPK